MSFQSIPEELHWIYMLARDPQQIKKTALRRTFELNVWFKLTAAIFYTRQLLFHEELLRKKQSLHEVIFGKALNSCFGCYSILSDLQLQLCFEVTDMLRCRWSLTTSRPLMVVQLARCLAKLSLTFQHLQICQRFWRWFKRHCHLKITYDHMTITNLFVLVLSDG